MPGKVVTMEKLKRILSSQKLAWFLLIIGAVLIFYYYFEKIPQIYIVWELMDEFGYLADAAYLSGNAWNYVTDFYYGYGYSLLLVPLFFFCETGIEIIRGAIAVNALNVVLLFLVQYGVMSKLWKNRNRSLFVLVSFALCFYPYIVASGLKVVCEVTLTLLVWLCGFLLYQALDTGKWYYYVLLVTCACYMFFVHARSFVFSGVLAGVILLLLLVKKINVKQCMLMLLTMVILLPIGFQVKSQVIQQVYVKELVQQIEETASIERNTNVYRTSQALMETDGESAQETEVVSQLEESAIEADEKTAEEPIEQPVKNTVQNLLSPMYIVNRILNVFSNFSVWYLYGFVCRNFYLFVATLGMFHIGIYAVCKELFSEWRKEKQIGTANAVKFLFVLGAVMALLATVVQAPYSLERPAYNFYGRYYEYTVVPVMFFGISYCIQKRLSIVEKVMWLILGLACYWFTKDFANYLEVQNLEFDSFRLASISYFTEAHYFRAVIEEAFVSVLILGFLGALLNYYKESRAFILCLFLLLFVNHNDTMEQEILYLQRENQADLEMITYLQTNYDTDEVYFLNAGFTYKDAYAGLQPLLGKDDLIVIEGEENSSLKTGDIFISFHNNPYVEQMEQNITQIYNTTYYELYLVE